MLNRKRPKHRPAPQNSGRQPRRSAAVFWALDTEQVGYWLWFHIPLPASYSGVLCVGERSFPFDQSDYNSQATAIAFSNHGLSWVDGQRVELSLWEVPSKQGDWASLCLPAPDASPEIRIEPVKATIREGEGVVYLLRANGILTEDLQVPVSVSTDGDFGAGSGVRWVGIRRGTNRTYHRSRLRMTTPRRRTAPSRRRCAPGSGTR